jgi:predicted nucleic acid-binding protein
MYNTIFVDANIILNFFDPTRKFHTSSSKFYRYALTNNIKLFTSCDIITTLYYIESKIDKKLALLKIQNINKTLKVIEFSNKEIVETCTLMLSKPSKPTVQFILMVYLVSPEKPNNPLKQGL